MKWKEFVALGQRAVDLMNDPDGNPDVAMSIMGHRIDMQKTRASKREVAYIAAGGQYAPAAIPGVPQAEAPGTPNPLEYISATIGVQPPMLLIELFPAGGK